MAHKQVIIIRKKYIKNKEKLVKDVAICSFQAAKDTKRRHPTIFKKWIRAGQKKIAVRLDNKDIVEIINYCKRNSICWSYNDNTKINSSTSYLFVLGPHLESKLDPITGQLRLL